MVSQKPCKTLVKWRFPAIAKDLWEEETGRNTAQDGSRTVKTLREINVSLPWHMPTSCLCWRVIGNVMVSWKPDKSLRKLRFGACWQERLMLPNPTSLCDCTVSGKHRFHMAAQKSCKTIVDLKILQCTHHPALGRRRPPATARELWVWCKRFNKPYLSASYMRNGRWHSDTS